MSSSPHAAGSRARAGSSSGTMAGITILGFGTVILLGALCYAVVAVVFVAARRFAN